MKVIPAYAENIIVTIIYNGNHSWYITDKEIWYMDYEKRIRKFEESGYAVNIDYIDDLRKELLILDVSTIGIFKERLIDFKVGTEELKNFLNNIKDKNEDWYYDLSPSLYIDFDKKILYSAYREMDSYENYAPKGWHAEYKEFLENVPLQERYWIDEENRSCFEKVGIIQEALMKGLEIVKTEVDK